MFYLGLTLVAGDFRGVLEHPRALAAGLLGQVLLVPLLAFVVALTFRLDPVMAVGVMVVGASPGGVSSGLLTHLARGDTALSISLTALTSLASVVTLPIVIGLSYQYFMSSSLQVDLPLFAMVRGVFLLTTLPVVLGMLLRWRWPYWVNKVEPMGQRVATVLFVCIVAATFWDQREVLSQQLPVLGPAILLLNVAIQGVAYLFAWSVRLQARYRVAIVIECGLHNAALGIVVCMQWLHAPAMSAPSMVYALLMNVGAIAVVVLSRRWLRA